MLRIRATGRHNHLKRIPNTESGCMDTKTLAALVKAGETDLVEFKREWWDLTTNRGKAQLARHTLAMANTVASGQSGLLIFGVTDSKAGGAIVGVPLTPSQESIAQILDVYTHPAPRIRLSEITYGDKRVSVLEILWNEFQPHYATRDIDTDLSTDAVYVRRAGTVGRLKPTEFEYMVRAKDARL